MKYNVRIGYYIPTIIYNVNNCGLLENTLFTSLSM